MRSFLTVLILLITFGGNRASGQGWQWGISNDQPFSGVIEAVPIATDRFGNIFAGGNIFGDDSVTIGPFTLADTFGLQGTIIVKANPAGSILWVFHIGSGFNELKAIAADIAGNLYVSGIYLDSFCTIGPYTLVNDTPYHSMSFLAKLSTTGSVLWAQNVAHAAGYLRGGLGVDDAGYIYVASEFSGHEATIGTTTLVNAADPSSDIYLAKFDGMGNPIWATGFGAEDYELCNGLAVAGDGSCYIIGSTASPVLTVGSDTLIDSTGAVYPFYAKFDNSGHPVWAKTMYRHTTPFGITVDDKENIYLCGYIDSSRIFGSDTLTLVGTRNAFIGKYDSTGKIEWANSASGVAYTTAYSVSADHCGNVWVGGSSDGVLNCNGNLVDTPSAGADRFFLVAYDHCGHYIPGTGSMLGSGGDDMLGIIYDGQGHVYLSADYEVLPLKVGSVTLPMPGFAQENLLVAKYLCPPMPCDMSVCCTAAPAAGFADSSDGSFFVYTGTAGYDSLKWDFGDGAFAYTDTVTHTMSAGSHYVCVTVYKGCGADTFCADVNVTGTLAAPHQPSVAGVTIFPNPAATSITIHSRTAFSPGSTAILYDVTGRKVASYALSGENTVVSIATLPSGTYECRIMTGSNSMVKKIVVMR